MKETNVGIQEESASEHTVLANEPKVTNRSLSHFPKHENEHHISPVRQTGLGIFLHGERLFTTRRNGSLRFRSLTVALYLSFTACGGSDDSQAGSQLFPRTEVSMETDRPPDTVEIILDEYWIGMPSVLPSGRTVLRLENHGFEEHNLLFVMKQADSVVWETEGRLSPFESRIVTSYFEPGIYSAVCDFSGHEGRGMFLDFTVQAGPVGGGSGR
ncbi:uncharacterized protein METZ01_LOCUS213353 [marine metagenome]|uniref:EfeO-type cupredoxin-like domain-containing protein n=1 Tax=marine metagenome TaxID=408172 RepID=A0A382FCX1_9ZZZZ